MLTLIEMNTRANTNPTNAKARKIHTIVWCRLVVLIQGLGGGRASQLFEERTRRFREREREDRRTRG